MARPTRQQRRDRRAQQPALAGPGNAPPTPPARPTQRGGGGDEYERRQRTSENVSRGGPFRFFHESYGELKKVEWPDQKAVISGTVVVIVACVIVGAYLWLNDRLWSYVVQHVLLH
jgi:preprotein translocase subunit SecE